MNQLIAQLFGSSLSVLDRNRVFVRCKFNILIGLFGTAVLFQLFLIQLSDLAQSFFVKES